MTYPLPQKCPETSGQMEVWLLHRSIHTILRGAIGFKCWIFEWNIVEYWTPRVDQKCGESGAFWFPTTMVSTVASGADFQNIKVQNLSEPIRFSLLVDPNRDSWRLRILRRGSVDTMTMSQDNYIEKPMKRRICTILTSHLPQWYFRKTWPKFFSGCGQRIGTCNL